MKRWEMAAAFAAMIVLMAACTRKEDMAAREWHVSMEVGESTKAISLAGNTLSNYWVVNDNVAVVSSSDIVGNLTVETVNAMDNKRASLVGNIWGVYDVGDNLGLYYPTVARDYWGQVGTLANLSNYAFLTANTTVTAVSGRELTLSNAVFSHCQAFCHLTLRRSSDNALIDVKSVRLFSLENKIVRRVSAAGAVTYGEIQLDINPSNIDGEVYFAIHDDLGGVAHYTIEVYDSGNHGYRGYYTQYIQDGHLYTTTLTLDNI